MKKIVIATILLLGTATVQAEYRMSVGLTESNHGPIPENGLMFKNKTTSPVTPPDEPPKPVCDYEESKTYWRTALGGNTIELKWNSEIVGTTIGNISTYDYNGYTYTKGDRMTFSGPPLFKVCRTIIIQ